MNVYISKTHANEFLEKLKEIRIVDDYFLDRARFGKEKIKIVSKYNTYDKISQLIPYLPENSMIIDQTEYPGKHFVLVIGEVDFSDFKTLQNEGFDLSMATKKNQSIRFHVWVPFECLASFYNQTFVRELTSINGKILDRTSFVFYGNEKQLQKLQMIASLYVSEFIIKGNEFHVNLLLQHFSEVFRALQGDYEKIEITD